VSRQPPAACRRAPPAASGPPRSRSEARRRSGLFASTSLTNEVLLQTIRRMAVGLGLGLILLGVVMLLNVERIDAWQRRRFPRRPITPTRWQGVLIVVFGTVVLIGEAINRT
jgi:hypothetical protein